MSQRGRPLLCNIYNKNAYFNGNEVKTSSVSTESNTLTTAASETVKLTDSTRCLLDRPADSYNTQIQTEADQKASRRAEQIRASRAKKTPDRRASRANTVKTDTDKSDTGRQLK
jgi:hypothetical protein